MEIPFYIRSFFINIRRVHELSFVNISSFDFYFVCVDLLLFHILEKLYEERVRVKTNRGNEKEKEKWIPLEFPNLLFRHSWQSFFVRLLNQQEIIHLSKNAVRSISGPRLFFLCSDESFVKIIA